jgi:hypothetical protein
MGSNHLGSGGGYVPRDGLPMLKVGDQFSIDTLNKIMEGINRASVVAGNGYQVRRYSNSTVIQPNQYVAGGAFKNFRVFGFVDENEQGFATIAIGTVNRTIPKINGKYLDQLDNDKLTPKVSVTAIGYIVIECRYEANKPFPSQSEIKFVTELPTQENGETSQYPLASVGFFPAKTNPATNTKDPAEVLVTQMHSQGNLSVARVKVGQSRFYWQWWTV